ncbi:LOW QUALITY PROTEIN: transmembrane emp24 domain-containing protein 1-like [Mya arenaria]|uniref:LOW QUALITY PROTEIN: transmembrane emp24 domain-containing protein 1-like n=1 Tax=Mya arenaria TaxID=6604 RepID=UPI0022E255E7|nr:LOW QUALITY PROTEIN: transmembrane emp24 domain-containing protein 1-like [Mya arenaria]
MDFKSVCVLLGMLIHTFAFEFDLTVEVGAGKMECFFQEIKTPGGVEVEYQVIDGGDLDINFFVQAPDGRVLISEHKKTDNYHKLDIQTAGDMKVCLDNTFSHFAIKLVFFELISDDDEEDDEGNWDGAGEEIAQLMDMTLDDFKQVLERMGQNLDKSRNLQTVLKMYEARDRNIVEMNFDRVNVLSGIQLGVMLTVGIVQVILIRSLFEDKKVSGLLKTKT